MDDDVPDVPDLQAGIDQAIAGSRELSRAMWGYFTALQEHGFSAAQALVLTAAYQTALFGQANAGT